MSLSLPKLVTVISFRGADWELEKSERKILTEDAPEL